MKKNVISAFMLLFTVAFINAQSTTNVGVDSGNQGTNNSFFGYQAGQLTTSSNNSFFGAKAGAKNTTGLYNLFIGNSSGFNNISASNNLFIGSFSGYSNVNGNFNLFLGANAGLNNTSASNNLFLGYNSGKENTTGNNNLFIGATSGLKNTLGNYNTFIGRNAGKSNTTASYNMFIGASAGATTTTGAHNTFLGYYSGNSNTTGLENVFIGSLAGRYSTGNKNVFIGPSAGHDNTGNNNIFIGHNAGYTETGSNKLYIENSNDATPLIYGDFSTNRIGINTKTFNSNESLAVKGNTFIDGTVKSTKSAVFGQDVSNSGYPLRLGKSVTGGKTNFEWHISASGYITKSIFDFDGKRRMQSFIHPDKTSMSCHDTLGSEFFKVHSSDDITFLQMGKSGSKIRIGKWADYLPNETMVVNGNSTLEGNLITTGVVGIGTSNPDPKFKLSVNGQVRAKEVTVETDWADYVFEKDYNLPTLKEVETHIKEKGHLKNIPSAKEVAEKGIKIGEINAKLLEKIEELTLYTISQEKKIQTQENRLKRLEQLLLDKQNK